jgi:hypothetical protein
MANRKAQRLIENARLAAERETLAAAQAEQEKRDAAENAANETRLEAECKAARDARYAARKARK